MMRIVIITDPAFRTDEASLIRLLLAEGVDRIHLRKPQASETEIRQLVESLPQELFSHLTLHDHLHLAVEYGIGGVHLNTRSPEPPAGFRGLVSRSCHSLGELATHTKEDYLFLSPIFDSISKEGYRAAFTAAQLRDAAVHGIVGTHTYALGGVLPEHLPDLRECGFGGAALLGYIWQDATPEKLIRRMAEIRKYNRES